MNIIFDVTNQKITRLDKNRLFSKSKNYVHAIFYFSGEWDGVAKTATFEKGGQVYNQILDKNDSCEVPWEVLDDCGVLSVSVFGGNLITTNQAYVDIGTSGYQSSGGEPKPPTPDAYTQLLKQVSEIPIKHIDVGEDMTLNLWEIEESCVVRVACSEGLIRIYGRKGADGEEAAESMWMKTSAFVGIVTVEDYEESMGQKFWRMYVPVGASDALLAYMYTSHCDGVWYCGHGYGKGYTANPLTFTGAAETSFDGSKPVSIELPPVYELPVKDGQVAITDIAKTGYYHYGTYGLVNFVGKTGTDGSEETVSALLTAAPLLCHVAYTEVSETSKIWQMIVFAYDWAKSICVELNNGTWSTKSSFLSAMTANKLIFSGAVEAEFNGSKEVNVKIPVAEADWETMKNRPFGEEELVILDWDGNTDNVETVTVTGGDETVTIAVKCGEYYEGDLLAWSEGSEIVWATSDDTSVTSVGALYDSGMTFDGAEVYLSDTRLSNGNGKTNVFFNVSSESGFDLSSVIDIDAILPKGLWYLIDSDNLLYHYSYKKVTKIPEEYLPATVPVIQTAEVNQIIRVKAVDDAGKPTEWEAVDMPDGDVPRTEKTEEDTAAELAPNILYVWPEMSELTITFADPEDVDITAEYHWIFTSGATATTLTIPGTVNVPSSFTVEANKKYEISVLEGCLACQSWEVS